MSEPFLKISSISDEFEYSNIREKKLPSNIIRSWSLAISGVQIYLDIALVNMWHPNLFGYLLGTKCGIQTYSDICSCQFYYISSSLAGRSACSPRPSQPTVCSLTYR